MQNLELLQFTVLTLNFVCVFAIGACVGSFLNVCAFRLPYEKSFLWPGSRCGHCYQPVKWYDNIPLLSYWVLRGRCRTCGSTFSSRYFFVELLVGLTFLALFYAEIYCNCLSLPELEFHRFQIAGGSVPRPACCVFVFHATLISLLILASICDLDHLEIPLGVTIGGTVLGLLGATLFPWPYPSSFAPPPPAPPAFGPAVNLPPQLGLYPWPVWYPTPSWLPPGSWQLGLLTGLAGAAMGSLVLRAVRFLFSVGRGIEGLGVGDADLMMMAGSFVGWQVILVAFAAGVFPGLFLGILNLLVRGRNVLPFGPSLAVGVLITLFGWQWAAPRLWPVLSEPFVLLFFGIFCPVVLLVVSFLLRIVRGTEPLDAALEADNKGAR